MREQVGQSKKSNNAVSIPTLKQPTRGFGLPSPEIAPQVNTETTEEPINKPLTHDISKISLRPQAKLSISQPGDFYEQQADSVAQQVMRRMAQPTNRHSIQRQEISEEKEDTDLQMKPLVNFVTPLVQRQQAPQEEEEVPAQDEEIQMKPLFGAITPLVQRQQAPEEEEEAPAQDEEIQMKSMVQRRPSTGEKSATSDLETSIKQSRGGGQPLADDIKQPMEQAFGADFGSVRVHTDANSDQLNKSIQARAFTTGQDIFFRQGEYSPGNSTGKELLAHELTHVVQQNGSSVQRKSLHVAPKENKLQRKYTDDGQTIQLRESSQKPNESENQNQTDTTVEVKPDTENSKQQNQPKTENPQTPSNPPAGGGNGTAEPPPVNKEGQNPLATQKQEKTKDTNSNQQKNTPQQPGKTEGQLPGASAGLPGKIPNQEAVKLPVADVVGKTAVALGANTGNSEKAPASAESDPEFQAVVNSTKQVAGKQKEHAPANSKAQEAQAASEPPGNEVESKAQANQVGEMGQAQTSGFDAAALKAKLMERIADMAPKTLQEADEFKNNNKLDSVKGDLSGQVKDEKKESQGDLEEKTKAKPDTSGIEAKQVTPLTPTNPGTAPGNVGAQKAAPKSKGQGEVEAPLQQDSQNLDQKMAEANVTEDQLAKSNEPEFQGALTAKNKAQTDAVQAPAKYRQQEQGIIANAKATAEATAQQHLQGMHGIRSQNLGQVAEQQVGTKGKDEKAREKVAGDIDKIYEGTKTKVEKILNDLDGKVIEAFDNGAADAKKAFEDYVDKRMKAYKDDRYSGFWGPGKWLVDKLLGLPSEVNAFYQEGRELYIKQMDGAINKVVNIISQGLTQAKAEIVKGKQEIQNYVNKLPQDLKGVGQEAAAAIESKFEELEQSVEDKQNELIDTLAQKYQENLQAVDAQIEEMKAANKGLIQKALDAVVGVVKTIIELTKMLIEVLARAASVVGEIIKDPIGFLSNLVSAVKQGFLNFMKNIGTHLQNGLISWLTGTMAEAGIQLPENFDLKGIFNLVMQLLGFTYEAIRAQAVKRLGEEKVSRMEQTVEVFQILATQGVAGIWQFVQDQIGDLNSLVIEPIKNFVIEKVITAGIEWVLSLLTPASAFIKACQGIYNIVKFFIENAQRIADLINSILDSIVAIASGSLDQAIKGVENALAKSLPVVISFLANLLGLGGISQKIQDIIKKLRKPMEKAVDWVIDKGKKAFGKVSNKFNNSKVGKKFNAAKDAAVEKYKAGKQWVEDKKAAGEKWFDDKKQALLDKTEKQKNRFLNTKAGKVLTRANDGLGKKLDALEKKRQSFNNKIEAAKEWPSKQLEKVQDKAAELRGKAGEKIKNSKFGKSVSDKWEKTKDWGNNKKEALGNKLGFGKGKEKDQEKAAKDGKADERTTEQKKADLENALGEAKRLIQNKTLSLDDIEKRLSQIKSKYKMTVCQLVIDSKKADKATVHVEGKINPQDETEPEEVQLYDKDRFEKLLYNALRKLGENHYKGYSKPDIRSGTARTVTLADPRGSGATASIADPRGAASTDKSTALNTPESDQDLLKRSRDEREKQIQSEGNKIHQALAKAQIAYSIASQAEFYPNNTFQVGAGNFFVCQLNNYYIVPTQEAKNVYSYNVNKDVKSILNTRLETLNNNLGKSERSLNAISENNKIPDDQKQQKILDLQKEIESMKSEKLTIQGLLDGQSPENRLNHIRENNEVFKQYTNVKQRVWVPRELTSQYDYGSNPVSPEEAKNFYKGFPNSIQGSSKKETVFVASVVTEPSRHSVAHITNMLLLDDKSQKVNEESVFKHLPMSQAGSDPNPKEIKDEDIDTRLDHGGKKVPKIVTDRDISAVTQHNPQLNQQLIQIFDAHKNDNDTIIVDKFADAIAKYLNLPKPD